MKFRDSAGFGKRIEFWVISRMLKEGLDVYLPLVDDQGIDAVVRRGGIHESNVSFAEVQVKARSKRAKRGTEAQFSVQKMKWDEPRHDYFFVFYSETFDKTWIMSWQEFIDESTEMKNGSYEGLRYIRFLGKRREQRLQRYLAENFNRIAGVVCR